MSAKHTGGYSIRCTHYRSVWPRSSTIKSGHPQPFQLKDLKMWHLELYSTCSFCFVFVHPRAVLIRLSSFQGFSTLHTNQAILDSGALVVVKWSESSPSTPTIRVRIVLPSCTNKRKRMKKMLGLAHNKKTLWLNVCYSYAKKCISRSQASNPGP